MQGLPVQDPVLIFAIVAMLIVLAPIAMARWRLPGMVGLIIAGAVLGPHAIGVLDYNASFVLFGTVGLLYLMFGAALEIDGAMLKRHWLSSVVFGLLTFAIPFGVGLGVGFLVLGLSLPAALLLSSVFASHTLLAYPIASRLGLSNHRVVTASVGGTFLSEPLALFALAVVADSPGSAFTAFTLIKPALVLLAFGAAAMLGLPRLARWFFRRVAEDGVAEFAFVLAAIFASASIGHVFGVEPVIGAFIAGLALNKVIPHTSALMARLRFSGDALFVPFFLLSIGMLLNVRPFAGDAHAWAVAGLVVLATFFAKWAAAELSRLILRFSGDEARVMFGMSLPHAAGTLATVLIGFKLKLFDHTVVNATILLILASCMLGPWLVDRYARRLALEAEPAESPGGLPPQRILVALSNPKSAPPLLELGTLLREKTQGQPLFPLCVVTRPDSSSEQVGEAERMLAKVTGQLKESDVPASPLTRIDPSLAVAITRAAREVRASDVVVGWSPRSDAQDLFFGSMLQKLLRATDLTLLVSRLSGPLAGTQRVVLAVPPYAERELGFAGATIRALRLAKVLGASALVVVPEESASGVKRRLKAMEVELPKLTPYDGFSQLARTLHETCRPGDLLLVLGARPGALSWTPQLAALPRRLPRLVGDLNLVVIYAAEPLPPGASAEERSQPIANPFLDEVTAH
jgi:Kef-type K+ transport system membrane component KefB